MSQLIPVGMFELVVFRQSDDPTKYAVQVIIPTELQTNPEAWIEAAACLTSYIGRHSDLGYEKALEVVTGRAMIYRDVAPPNPPDNPVATTGE